MTTVFREWIQKLGFKRLVFLALLGLVTLAYIASPLIALAACPQNGNPGGNPGKTRGSTSTSNGNVPQVTVTVAQSIRIDSGVYLVSGHTFQRASIAFLQIVGPDSKPITLTQYQQLLRYAATPKISPVKVRIEVSLLNKVTLFTQGQFITRTLANKPFGAVIVTTDNRQQLVAIAQQSSATPSPNPNSPIILRVPSSNIPN